MTFSFGYDPEAVIQDADIEMAELARSANEPPEPWPTCDDPRWPDCQEEVTNQYWCSKHWMIEYDCRRGRCRCPEPGCGRGR